MTNFPKFATHDAVHCFHCDRVLAPGSESAYARGWGEFKTDCPNCDLTTFYDLGGIPVAGAAVFGFQANRNPQRRLRILTAAVLAAIFLTGELTGCAPAPPTHAEMQRMGSETSFTIAMVNCQDKGKHISDVQADYALSLSAYDRQQYLLSTITSSKAIACVDARLTACERLHLGDCVPVKGERDGRILP